MATWELTTEYKKSAIEVQLWYKDGKIIRKLEGYRWGTFTCESDSKPDIDLVNEDSDYQIDGDGYDWELTDLNDGCWTDWTFPDDMPEEEQERLQNLWNDRWYEGLESEGWSQDDCEYYFNGPMKLTNVDTGQEWSGLTDPADVVTTIELPTPSAHTESAKWPFSPPVAIEEPEMTDWFPVDTKPAYKGFYEVLTKESINWPFPNRAEWTGKKWVFLDHTVEQWRGLAKKPE
jgi:hypothetical protein